MLKSIQDASRLKQETFTATPVRRDTSSSSQGLAQVRDTQASGNLGAITTWNCLSCIIDFIDGIFCCCCSCFRSMAETLGWIAPLDKPDPHAALKQALSLACAEKMQHHVNINLFIKNWCYWTDENTWDPAVQGAQMLQDFRKLELPLQTAVYAVVYGKERELIDSWAGTFVQKIEYYMQHVPPNNSSMRAILGNLAKPYLDESEKLLAQLQSLTS